MAVSYPTAWGNIIMIMYNIYFNPVFDRVTGLVAFTRTYLIILNTNADDKTYAGSPFCFPNLLRSMVSPDSKKVHPHAGSS